MQTRKSPMNKMTTRKKASKAMPGMKAMKAMAASSGSPRMKPMQGMMPTPMMGMNMGGMAMGKGYADGGMPMVVKDGKKVPSFAADGKGKMKHGGMAHGTKAPKGRGMAIMIAIGKPKGRGKS